MNIFKRLYIACRRFRHRHGFGVHSPFAFELITEIIYRRANYYAYESLRKERGSMFSCRLPHYPVRTDEQLFRLVNRFQPKTIVEVGTGSGWSIRYMFAAKQGARYVTFDTVGYEEVATRLKETSVEYRCVEKFTGGSACDIKDLGRSSAAQNLDEALLADYKAMLQSLSSVDLLHIAHTTSYEKVFEEALLRVSSQSLVIVEGIYVSKEKLSWWKRVVADERVGTTFDLYEMGLVLFDKSRPKQHYVA